MVAALARAGGGDENGLVVPLRPGGDGDAMNAAARKIQRIYLTLTLGNTLAASFIWGINTLFLLDAGLSNLEAFAANAFFTAGMVLFEVPTGVVADGWGRRVSFLLGTVTLAVSTYLYYLLWQLSAPFWCVGGGVGPARPGLHLLLGRGRGLARRRAALLGVRGRAGDRCSGGDRWCRASRCSPARWPAA